MAEQSLADQVKSEIQSLQSSVGDLQSSTRLADIRDRVEDLDSKVSGLNRRIKELRDLGYAFEKGMEEAAAGFEKEWSDRVPDIKSQADREARILESTLRPLDARVSALAGKSGSLEPSSQK